MNTEITIEPPTGMNPDRLAHLERDRWPEFERELRGRHNRKTHFVLSVWHGERPGWAWLVWQCRKWEEIVKVLNRHRVEYRWKDRRSVLELDDAQISRQP